MKAVVAAFNQEKALVGAAFSEIVQPVVKPMESFTALMQAHTCLVPDMMRSPPSTQRIR